MKRKLIFFSNIFQYFLKQLKLLWHIFKSYSIFYQFVKFHGAAIPFTVKAARMPRLIPI